METVKIKKKSTTDLFNDFFEEKKELESTLATLELLTDKNSINELNKGIKEIKQGKSKLMSFDEIDNL